MKIKLGIIVLLIISINRMRDKVLKLSVRGWSPLGP